METVILDRRVEAVEEVRLKQIEEERIFKEELARKEALRALRHKQKMHSKEGGHTQSVLNSVCVIYNNLIICKKLRVISLKNSFFIRCSESCAVRIGDTGIEYAGL